MLQKPYNFSCFYHPTKTLFLDDDKHFLYTIKLDLKDKINLQTFTECASVLDILNSFDYPESVMELILHSDKEEATLVSQLVEFNLGNLHKIIYNPLRFQQASVVVVDYLMPEMTGIEFCRKIKNKHIMKILLTAEADKDVAITAFNQGIIHHFMMKTRDDLNEELLKTITALQQRYFAHLSQIFWDSADKNFLKLMFKLDYLQLIEDTKKSSQAVEYYLLDKFGSTLFLDQKAHPTWLVLRDEQALQECVDIAEEQEASPRIISALKERKQLLFQLTKEDLQLPVNQWQNYLFDAKMLGKNYYYSIIRAQTKNHVEWNRIKSYSE